MAIKMKLCGESMTVVKTVGKEKKNPKCCISLTN